MGIDEYRKRMAHPQAQMILSRIRSRLIADPELFHLANTSPDIFSKFFDRELDLKREEDAREQRREALFAPEPEPEEPGRDWELENLKEEAKETEGRPEDVVPLLEHMEKGGGD